MAQPPALYDLVVLLDAEATDAQRTKVLSDCEKIIAKAGEIVSDQDWGLRGLAYEIRHKSTAQYHLLQFHGPREVLEQLDRLLHIADGVVRYRIIKLKPGTPPPPSAAPATDEPEAEVQAETAPEPEPVEPDPAPAA